MCVRVRVRARMRACACMFLDLLRIPDYVLRKTWNSGHSIAHRAVQT